MPKTPNRKNWKLILEVVIFLLFLVVVITALFWQIIERELRNYSPTAYSYTVTAETTTKFIMNQLFLDSTILSDNILTLKVDLTTGWSVVAKDTTSIAFKNNTSYLTVRSLPESETVEFEQPPEISKISTNNLGELFSIQLNQSELTEFLHNRFNIQGSLWQVYAENYSEVGCNEEKLACSNADINISNGSVSVPLAINCIGSSLEDLSKCDKLLKTMSATLFIDD